MNAFAYPVRPAIYFYDPDGDPIAARSLVSLTPDLEIGDDGALRPLTVMNPLEELTIATNGRGGQRAGSVTVRAARSIGGFLRFDLPGIGVAGVGASPPVSDARFPVRRQEGGITTGVAIHNLESSSGLVRCELRKEGVLLDAATIPLEPNGQTAWLGSSPAGGEILRVCPMPFDDVGDSIFADGVHLNKGTKSVIAITVNLRCL